MEPDPKDQRYRAPALDKGLDIIELLAVQPSGMTRAEIVKAMGKSASEIYRMLERLVARDYVSRSLEGDRYALTMKLFHLGAAYPPLRRLVMNAQPLMDEFANKSMQSIHLVVEDIGQGHVVAQASSRSAWEFRLRVGATLSLPDTNSGQTLLAFLDDDRATQILTAISGDPANLPEGLTDKLAAIRKTGYRLNPSLQLVGVTDISVPVRSANGVTVAVLTCPYLPRVESQPEGSAAMDVSAALLQLQDTAARISKT